jgi:DNA-binding transcriptional regulator YbjK
MATRMKPEARKADILEAAIKAAEKHGFADVRQKDIAEQAECGFGTVSLYFNTMTQMRRAIMRAAVERKNLKLIAQGLGIGHPEARKASDDIKKKALKLLSA